MSNRKRPQDEGEGGEKEMSVIEAFNKQSSERLEERVRVG